MKRLIEATCFTVHRMDAGMIERCITLRIMPGLEPKAGEPEPFPVVIGERLDGTTFEIGAELIEEINFDVPRWSEAIAAPTKSEAT